ncbi:hypothetical protein HRG_008347 [Hirsutella rhossiliensis]|uniref:Uncharacterized protein n=1 Tax=Hirsutella rhossiliensis TaxID=111463 RepID=A0A9P8MW07_9HYPO|nr:uncharacterized protein HRG_08347 [Hirsutella rhossiliensis]KAH0960192.1 hypothetical protein HRG_08347 [Hirsutella rhossiliensis]
MSGKVNLHVRGFPRFLSFGGFTDLTEGNQADFASARASSVFRYAGIDGAGDGGQYLTDDPATTRTIGLARAVEKELGSGNPVVPVMVSYTCNLTLGDVGGMLQNPDRLAHSFANLILSLNLATKAADEDHPMPAAYIVNPDFLGSCQQQALAPDYTMPVRHPLTQALRHWRISASLPDSITDTLRGYVHALNWLVRTVEPTVSFGWSVSIWGGGSSSWVQSTDDEPRELASKTSSYIKSLGVCDGDDRPDFFAVDRYEADDLTMRSYMNGYCYGPREWRRFFDFCGALGEQLEAPIMLWQIPASHIPLSNDNVNDEFESQHWGTGGSYILGDAGVKSDYHNINPKILALKLDRALMPATNSVEEVFKRAEPFDLSNPAYKDLPLRGIFAMLLGGGATTGIVSSIGNPEPWVRDKLKEYMQDPVQLPSSE